MSVLVTGGFGAIGAWVVRQLLAEDRDVVILARRDHPEKLADVRDRIRVMIGSIEDPAVVQHVMEREGITEVCHLAADHGGEQKSNPLGVIGINVAGSVNLLEAARRTGVASFVLASSKSVYGPPSESYGYPAYVPVPEDSAPAPLDFYGSTKLAAEALSQSYTQLFGLPVTALRFASTFGPGKEIGRHGSFATVTAMIDAAWRGQEFSANGADQRSDYIYYPDIARAVIASVDRKDPTFEILNIGTGRGYTLFEIAEECRKVKPGFRPQLTGGLEYTPGEPSLAFVLDVTRAEQILGFRAAFDMAAAVEHYGAFLDRPL